LKKLPLLKRWIQKLFPQRQIYFLRPKNHVDFLPNSLPLPLQRNSKYPFDSNIFDLKYLGKDQTLGFPVVIMLRVTLSFTYAGALRVITCLLRL